MNPILGRYHARNNELAAKGITAGADPAMATGAPVVGLIIYRHELKKAADPVATKAECVEQYRELFANPFAAAELSYIDEVIMPEQTRHRLCAALELMGGKRAHRPSKKHGNIPL